ncbi:MAG: 50S ribosomal protein L7/L12 [Patescibacteria group bacterium]
MSEDKKELSKNVAKLLDEIKKLTLVEAAELVHAMEEEFGVTASAPVAVAQVGVAPAGGVPAEAEEEKAIVDVMMTAVGEQKLAVIKALRAVKPELGLKEAKDATEGELPFLVAGGVKREDAMNMKKTLEEAGAKVELK